MTVYKGSAVKLEVGAFDTATEAKCFPITLSCLAPELLYVARFNYSIKSATTDELRRRYLEFDAWQKAGALFGEIESQVLALGPAGFVVLASAFRLKAVDGGGERILYEEKPGRPVAVFSGGADSDRPKPLSSSLLILAPGALIAINGAEQSRDRAFIANPKPGNYGITATLADGTTFTETRKLSASSSERVAFATRGEVSVISKIPGDLYLDGAFRAKVQAGKSLSIDNIPIGTRVLELRYEGGESESLSVLVSGGKLSQANFVYSLLTRGLMVFVQGGSISMGSSEGADNEKPVHQVRLSDYWISKYEVTQKLWQAVMGSNPSDFKGEDLPVEQVSWYDAVNFCNKLSAREDLKPAYTILGTNVSCDWSANGYRLPTEAEWEYAARGGSAGKAQNVKYAGSSNVGDVGWYSGNSGGTTQPVGQKRPNALGVYDMSGNVWEWCWDWYDSGYYGKSPPMDPMGAASGGYRVVRGGSWSYDVSYLRVSYRSYDDPSLRRSYLGFRLARR